MSASPPKLWNALVRTHHITSRKKVAKLKQAASNHEVFVLLRSGGPPGLMYVEGTARGVEDWVGVVQVDSGLTAERKRLRYKDYQLAARPANVKHDACAEREARVVERDGLQETDTVKGFAGQMGRRGVYTWWRDAMGYTGKDEHL
ncbi:hypothetical protein LTR08_004671 [Meristemomyces frigidus]|nr:hypothetical protein LTR08_004671 [Meristemomyces frigidus]